MVSSVIVSRNTLHLLEDCLRSLYIDRETTHGQIIVVDNASTDGSVDMIASEFPQVQLICNSENLGFARANNQGIHASTGRYVFFLNSDTTVPTGTLSTLVQFMDDHSSVAACGPRLARADGSTQPFAFGSDPTLAYILARGWNRLIFHRSLQNWETHIVKPVDWVSGAALIARHDALDQIGGFDEKFFMYFEDNDLCLRLRRAGGQIFYNPAVTVTHLGGASLEQNASRTRYYDASLRYFYSKHYSLLARIGLELMLPFYRRLN